MQYNRKNCEELYLEEFEQLISRQGKIDFKDAIKSLAPKFVSRADWEALFIAIQRTAIGIARKEFLDLGFEFDDDDITPEVSWIPCPEWPPPGWYLRL